MSKRRTERQLTKDDDPEADEAAEAGEWTAADPAKIAQRKIVKAVSRTASKPGGEGSEDAAPSAFPRFDFGLSADSTEDSSSSSDTVEWPYMENTSATSTADEATGVPGEGEEKGKYEKKAEDEWNSGFSWGDGDTSTATFDWGAGTEGGDNPFAAATAAGADAFVLSSEAFNTSKLPSTSIAQNFEGREAECAGTEEDHTYVRTPARVYILKEPEVEPASEMGKTEGSAVLGTEAKKEENGETEDSDKAKSENGEEDEAGEKKGKTKKFVEIGNGDLYINAYDKDGRKNARMVLRADRTQRLVLNCPVFKDMVNEAHGDKYVKFMSLDLEGQLQLYLLKVANKAVVNQVLEGIRKALDSLDS
eukprot:gb/GEZN01006491.1/.p1 GENE.gb/GEZN01006491.1/~~gb/GEZN01006491.1/.p1  ORF type:complete len:363 (-),score=86.60 gb/GEZN01006491.1/:470-1558(-)